jgi:type IV pili sensor histidine kinase/response regulator
MKHVLIIEDDLALARVYSLLLGLMDAQAEICRDGEIALRRISEDTPAPALILLDLHLPKVNGENVLTQIKSNARYSNTDVVIATGDAGWGKRLAEQTGLKVLIKPISAMDLKLCV